MCTLHCATSMLQRIRQHKTFAAVVIAVFALLLLAAALSGARVRAASPADLVGADVCTTSQMLAVGHEDHALPASWDTVAAIARTVRTRPIACCVLHWRRRCCGLPMCTVHPYRPST